jgi:hypothetical protein
MKTLADFGELNAAETKLLQCSVSGEAAIISEMRPDKAFKSGKKANTVRAELIRWVALGGDAAYPLHAHGVQLMGAWIDEELDLQGAILKANLILVRCHIAQSPNMRGMQLNGSLNLQGSYLAARLVASAAQIAGDMVLRSDANYRFESAGEVCLIGARIGGDLSCGGAYLNPRAGQDALTTDGAQIAGSIFLRSDSNHRFNSRGTIRLHGARIGGTLDCNGAQLNPQAGQDALSADNTRIAGSVILCSYANHRFESIGTVRLLGAKIGGNLGCVGVKLNPQVGHYALCVDGAQIAGNVFLYGDADHHSESSGTVSLVGANVKGGLFLRPNYNHPIETASCVTLDVSHCTVGFLQSDVVTFGEGLVLDGFVCGSLRGAYWQTSDYLAWLYKQLPNHYGRINKPNLFKPQPWKQLISVLRNMGHNDMANDISIAFEMQRYAIGLVKGSSRPLHQLFGWLAGYGYRPLNLVKVMLMIWFSFALCYWCAAYNGVFAPSDPLVFQHNDYKTCRTINTAGEYDPKVINNKIKASQNWYTCDALKGEYTTFSPLAYSLDVILPLVDLGQEKTWSTYISTPNANGFAEFAKLSVNHVIRLMVWFEILFG